MGARYLHAFQASPGQVTLHAMALQLQNNHLLEVLIAKLTGMLISSIYLGPNPRKLIPFHNFLPPLKA